jgi:hypothetical protein
MRTLLVLLATLWSACAPEPPSAASVTSLNDYSHVVTAAGRRFRVIRTGPVVRGAGSTVGLMISYLGESRVLDDLVRDSDELVRALGPELELTGEKQLVVRAEWQVASKAEKPRIAPFDVLFKLKSAGWQRVQPDEDTPVPGSSRLPPLNDTAYPFNEAKLTAAGSAAQDFLALLDAGEIEQVVGVMSLAFRAEIADKRERFIAVLEQRQTLGIPGVRRELYRMLTRDRHVAQTAPEAVLIQFECQPVQGARILERMVLAPDGTGFRIAGYAFQPIPGPSAQAER